MTTDDLLLFRLCASTFATVSHYFLSGQVFYAPVTHKMTFEEASEECKKRKAVLASPGQLHAAWRQGLDRCDYGWLSDGSVRHPVAVPRTKCGGGQLGVRTMYRYRNQTGFPEPTRKFGAYCFTGKNSLQDSCCYSLLHLEFVMEQSVTYICDVYVRRDRK